MNHNELGPRCWGKISGTSPSIQRAPYHVHTNFCGAFTGENVCVVTLLHIDTSHILIVNTL